MFLLVDEETDKLHTEQKTRFRRETASLKLLPHQPRLVEMKKGSNGYGFYLRAGPEQKGEALDEQKAWQWNQLNNEVQFFILVRLQSAVRPPTS